MGVWNRWHKLGAVLGLVPAMFVAQHAALGGFPKAEGCSGGAPAVGWSSLNVVSPNGLDRVPIATDGFVLLKGRFDSPYLDAQLNGASVSAEDESGNALPGQLRLLRADVYDDITIGHLGWQADEPLAIGTVVRLTWSAAEADVGAGGAGGVGAAAVESESIELEVVAEPTPLPTPTAMLGPWLEVRHGVGELVECETYNSCGTNVLEVPSRETRLLGVETRGELTEIAGTVAWEVRAETNSPKNGVELLRRTPRSLISGQSALDVDAGAVAFADDATDYCVVVVVKDLRTGDELRSEPLCEAPGEPEAERSDHSLPSCDAPPTPESTALWCENRADDELCDEMEQGAGGNAPSGSDPPRAEEPEGRAPRLSRGCQFGLARGDLALAAASLCAIALLIAQRRRRLPR